MSENQISRRQLVGGAAPIAAASAAVAQPTAARAAELVQQPAGQTVVQLCVCGLKAGLRDQEVRARIRQAEREFLNTLTDDQVRAYSRISDASTDAEVAEFYALVREVQRHVPQLGVAISLVADHVLDAYSGECGQCCLPLWEPYGVITI